MIIVINVLLLNHESGKWSEIFLLSIEGIAGKNIKYFIGITGAV